MYHCTLFSLFNNKSFVAYVLFCCSTKDSREQNNFTVEIKRTIIIIQIIKADFVLFLSNNPSV